MKKKSNTRKYKYPKENDEELIDNSHKSSDKEKEKRKMKKKKTNKNSINKNKDIVKEIIENKVAEIKNKILIEEEKQIFINMYENNFEEILDSEEASNSNSDDNLDINKIKIKFELIHIK